MRLGFCHACSNTFLQVTPLNYAWGVGRVGTLGWFGGPSRPRRVRTFRESAAGLAFSVVAHPKLRRSVRAIVLDEGDRVLLCRFDLPSQGMIVWAPPGGGVEHDETRLQALRRELDEEIGLALVDEPPLIWHQRVVAHGHAEGYDGIVNDYYLIETGHFEPHGSLSADALRAENITEFRWWALDTSKHTGVMLSSGPEIWLPY